MSNTRTEEETIQIIVDNITELTTTRIDTDKADTALRALYTEIGQSQEFDIYWFENPLSMAIGTTMHELAKEEEMPSLTSTDLADLKALARKEWDKRQLDGGAIPPALGVN